MTERDADNEPARGRRWAALAADAAIIWGISVALLVGLLLATHVFLAHRYAPGRIFDHFSRLTPQQKAAYTGWRPSDLNDMLTATWSPGWIYEPWLGFREKPRSSRFVNVSEDGIRATAGGARSLSDFVPGSIFLFGGSTLFGYGVPDGQTIASHLQSIAGGRARVFDFGRAFYYTAQENVLFESLLRAGFRPAAVGFLDGLNERCDIDAYQAQLASLFARAQGEYQWHWADALQPLLFAAARLRKRFLPGKEPAFGVDLHRLDCVRFGRHAPLREVVRENLEDRAAICRRYRLRCVSFVQPIAGVHGRHPDYVMLPQGERDKLRRKFEHLSAAFRAAGMIDVTDALDRLPGPAYVDDLHYSDAASAAIAARMAPYLLSPQGAPGDSLR